MWLCHNFSPRLRRGGGFFCRGFAPAPHFSHRRRSESSYLLEKRAPLLLLEKFLSYLFPAKGRVNGSPETRCFAACFGLPAAGRDFFLAGASPLHPISHRRIPVMTGIRFYSRKEHPFLSHRRRSESSLLLEKRGHLSS